MKLTLSPPHLPPKHSSEINLYNNFLFLIMNCNLFIKLIATLLLGSCSAYLKLLTPYSSLSQSAASGLSYRSTSYTSRPLLPSYSIRKSCLQESTASSEITAKDPTFGEKAWKAYLKTTDTLTTLFPLWTVLFAGVALLKPSTFAWFSTKYFTASLGALMLSMGITLTLDDFIRVGKEPGAVIVGFLLCYLLCPALGFALGKAFNLPLDLISGLVLVGSINGGQASNLCTYIARGDVALSVLMTTVTTIAGIFTTPLLCKTILGAVVPVDAVGIAISCLQVILAPIVLGMATNKFLPNVVKAVLPITPVIGVVSTCLLVASAVAQCAPAILTAGTQLQLPVLLLHLISGLAGYFVPRWMNFSEVQCRTMAIETAMKSSAFGFLLAKLHFKQYGARVPSAVSVVWMALVGATLAVIWRFIPVKEVEKKTTISASAVI